MRKFTNPLDSIHVASPCSADWNEMYGNDRKRFCSDCKLNVYNLSDMTRQEAENLLMISEGRLCVRFFRRADGTVLTKNCPVGWQAVKQHVSRVATAAFSIIAGFFGGLVAFDQSKEIKNHQSKLPALNKQNAVNSAIRVQIPAEIPQVGEINGINGQFEMGGAPTELIYKEDQKIRKPRKADRTIFSNNFSWL